MADDTQRAPTAEEIAQATEITTAGAVAAAEASGEQDARERASDAISTKAREINVTLSDTDKNQLVDMLIERMAALGAFDSPPQVPAPAAAAAATPEAAAEQAAAEAEQQPPPRKRTFAERFAGL